MSKILLVEDDEEVAEAVIDALASANHVVDWTVDGNDAIDRLALYSFDLAILDWQLPSSSAIEICRRHRAEGGHTPVLILTARSHISDKEDGFDAGADDYLTKPFELRELLARIKALLRRPAKTRTERITLGALSLDIEECALIRRGHKFALMPRELALLEFLMRNPNQFFSAEALLDRVWSSQSGASEDAVRQCVLRIRKKLDEDDGAEKIVTLKGRGYKITDGCEMSV